VQRQSIYLLPSHTDIATNSVKTKHTKLKTCHLAL
jgi:hypothetical protein